jgi:hypothetical protein
MNLRRKIKEEINKTLLNEDTVCPASIWMKCGEFMPGCNAPFTGIHKGKCAYANCCPGNGWGGHDNVRPEENDDNMIGESRGYRR